MKTIKPVEILHYNKEGRPSTLSLYKHSLIRPPIKVIFAKNIQDKAMAIIKVFLNVFRLQDVLQALGIPITVGLGPSPRTFKSMSINDRIFYSLKGV